MQIDNLEDLYLIKSSLESKVTHIENSIERITKVQYSNIRKMKDDIFRATELIKLLDKEIVEQSKFKVI